jgi:Ca-activated chloride channel family protein
MINTWEKYDREQLRSTELQQRIKQLADWEEKLIEKVRPTLDESDSPRKFQTGYETSREQKQLAEELAVLQKEPIDDEELQKKWERFPEIQKMTEESTELLAKHRPEEAMPKQQAGLDFLRSLLKQEQNQNQQQDQEQNGQEQQDQVQKQQPQDNGEQESDNDRPQSAQQEWESEQREESPEERAERQIMQVRRKEQAEKERREQIKILLMQVEPVEKNW